MASIAYFLLFPRTDYVDTRDKPMDDVPAKQMLVVHQAAVNLAKTVCNGGLFLYEKIGDTSPVFCKDGLESVSIKTNTDFRPTAISVSMFPLKTDAEHRPTKINDQDIKVRIACLDVNTGDSVSVCGGKDTAAFLTTYVPIEKYTSKMPMLPYMLAKAFNFQYTGKPLLVNGHQSYVRINTYCGYVDGFDEDSLPVFAEPNNLPPFVVNPTGGLDAINNTQYQIAVLPPYVASLAGDKDYAICVTPLNSFSGAQLTSTVHED